MVEKNLFYSTIFDSSTTPILLPMHFGVKSKKTAKSLTQYYVHISVKVFVNSKSYLLSNVLLTKKVKKLLKFNYKAFSSTFRQKNLLL